jgi:hypothetical protein
MMSSPMTAPMATPSIAIRPGMAGTALASAERGPNSHRVTSTEANSKIVVPANSLSHARAWVHCMTCSSSP